MSESIRRKIFLGIFLPLPLLAVICAILFWQLDRWKKETVWVERSGQVLAESHLAQRFLIDQETGVRGYLLTGEKVFLQPYESGTEQYGSQIEQLTKLVGDDPEQEKRLGQLRALYRNWRAQVESALVSPGADRTKTVASALSRKAEMDAMRVIFGDLIEHEQDLLARRQGNAEASSRAVLAAAPILILATAIGLAWIIYRLAKHIDLMYRDALAERDRLLLREQQARSAAEALAEEVTERSREMEKVVVDVRSQRDQARRRLSELGEAQV